jgi:hypothetical protein
MPLNTDSCLVAPPWTGSGNPSSPAQGVPQNRLAADALVLLGNVSANAKPCACGDDDDGGGHGKLAGCGCW